MRTPAVVLFLAAAVAPACSTIYYESWELLGREKRDLLRSAFVSMVGEQKEAAENFRTALDRVKGLTGFQGGDLEKEYDRLKDAWEDADGSASDIDSRIAEIEEVSADLFEEWEREIATITTPSLAESSRTKLRESKERYEQAHGTMTESRRRMTPVLAVLNDHVLYLKHNLNAQAVGALTGTMASVESDVAALQSSIEAAIREAEGFAKTLEP